MRFAIRDLALELLDLPQGTNVRLKFIRSPLCGDFAGRAESAACVGCV